MSKIINRLGLYPYICLHYLPSIEPPPKKVKIQGTYLISSLNIKYDTPKWLHKSYLTTTIQQTQQVFFYAFV